jgi:hypothetical protein
MGPDLKLVRKKNRKGGRSLSVTDKANADGRAPSEGAAV